MTAYIIMRSLRRRRGGYYGGNDPAGMIFVLVFIFLMFAIPLGGYFLLYHFNCPVELESGDQTWQLTLDDSTQVVGLTDDTATRLSRFADCCEHQISYQDQSYILVNWDSTHRVLNLQRSD